MPGPSFDGQLRRSTLPPGTAGKPEKKTRRLCQKLTVLPRTDAGKVIEKRPFASDSA